MIKPPVALFVYNRYDYLPTVINAIRDSNPAKLYIFSDGPKDSQAVHGVAKVRDIIKQIDWIKPDVTEHNKNLGLSASIKFGIDEVLSNYERVVVIEDDVCVAPGFYEYMTAALEVYKNVHGVAGVTGLRYPFELLEPKDYPYDTFLFPRFCSWGWGTWKHVWQSLDWDRKNISTRLQSYKLPLDIGGKDMKTTFHHYMSGSLSGSWDVNFAANMLLKDQVFAWPTWNMVNNLGLLEGTHASGEAPPWNLEVEKRKHKGPYKFFTDFYIQPVIYANFLSFFESVTKDDHNVIREGGTMVAKKLAKRVIGKTRRLVNGRKKIEVAPKPDPSEYTTTNGPMEVPVQKEAYFIALNNYLKEGDEVLDVGAGIGYGLNLLAIRAKHVSGVDIDEKAIDYCERHVRGKNPKLKDLKVYDGYHLPYKDKSFDVITSIDVIEHVEKYDEFITELLRVARKAVILSTPNRRPEYTNPDGTPRNYWHLREWNRKELNDILKKHGVKVEWYHVNGPWEGPFTISRQVRADTMTLTPVLLLK